MTRKTTLTMVSLLSLTLAAGVAVAGPHGERGQGMGHGMMMPSFEERDTDGDGKITREEMDARRLERIKSMDPDGDGVITLDEMKAHAGEMARQRAEKMAEKMFTNLDADKDGKLSAAEALAGRMGGKRGADRMFGMVDRDDDGAISKDEFDRAAERMQKMRGEGGRGEGRKGMHGEGEGRKGMHGEGGRMGEHGGMQGKGPEGRGPNAQMPKPQN